MRRHKKSSSRLPFPGIHSARALPSTHPRKTTLGTSHTPKNDRFPLSWEICATRL